MEENRVTLLTATGWITGVQITGDKAEKLIAEKASGLKSDPADLIVLEDCRVQGWGEESAGQIVLKRSAVMGVKVG